MAAPVSPASACGDVLLRVLAVELHGRVAALTGPPVTITSPGLTLESASSADWIAAAVALYGERRGRLAVEGQRERAARRVTRTVCVSSVFMSLCGEKPPELPPPDGVSSPVTSHRLLCLSKSMSPATWQHAPRLLETRRIFCSLREVQRRVRAVDELEARELEVARRTGPTRSATARSVGAERVRRRRDRLGRAVGLLDVATVCGRVVQVDPLVGRRSRCRSPARRGRPRCWCRPAAWRSTFELPSLGSCRRSWPPRAVCRTRPSGSTSKPIGSLRFGLTEILVCW